MELSHGQYVVLNGKGKVEMSDFAKSVAIASGLRMESYLVDVYPVSEYNLEFNVIGITSGRVVIGHNTTDCLSEYGLIKEVKACYTN